MRKPAPLCRRGRDRGAVVEPQAVAIWVDGVTVRIANYGDIDEAPGAAVRLGESRG
jgi:hypothetical protein